MKNNPRIALDCFGNKCLFHLMTGESIIGIVIDDSLNKFTVSTSDGFDKTFSQKIVDSYFVLTNDSLNGLSQIRNQLLGASTPRIKGNLKTKKLIIIGAGASSDFGAERQDFKVPVSNEIFKDENLINKFRGALELKPQIQTVIQMGESLEDYFQEKWKNINLDGDLDDLYRLINTQYFIQQYFWDASMKLNNSYPNNYTFLVRHIQKYLQIQKNENVAIVSFNYDTLFEKALTHFSYDKFEKIEDYIFSKKEGFCNLKPIMVFKPHGSWNWVHYFEKQVLDVASVIYNEQNTPTVIADLIYRNKWNIADIISNIAPHLEKSDIQLQEMLTVFLNKFSIIQDNSRFKVGYYPNLLLPFKYKDEFLMPKLHENMLSHKLEDVEEILIVGWKGTENKFNSLLGRKLGSKKIKVTYVSPKSQTVETELKNYLKLAEFTRYQGTFSNYIKDLNKTGFTQNFFE